MKEALWNALLREQGHVCCYCGMRIQYGAQASPEHDSEPVEGSHIEHVLPQEHFPERRFSYGNLLISCQAETREPHEPNHCGHHNGSWPDAGQKERFIAPTRPDCDRYFRYLGSGDVEPDGDEPGRDAAGETIKHLNLNAPRLKVSRRLVMDTVVEDLERLQDDPPGAWVREYLNITPAQDNDYHVPAFLAAIRYVLREARS